MPKGDIQMIRSQFTHYLLDHCWNVYRHQIFLQPHVSMITESCTKTCVQFYDTIKHTHFEPNIYVENNQKKLSKRIIVGLFYCQFVYWQ